MLITQARNRQHLLVDGAGVSQLPTGPCTADWTLQDFLHCVLFVMQPLCIDVHSCLRPNLSPDTNGHATPLLAMPAGAELGPRWSGRTHAPR